MAYRDKYDPRSREAKLRHYYKNRDQYYARNAAKKRQLRAILKDMKSHPCMDCGHTFPPVAMDFDHRDPTTKLWGPSELPKAGSFRILLAELAKCDLVCAICHRIREETRRKQTPRAAPRSSPSDDRPPTLF